jgi:hypothetical protein
VHCIFDQSRRTRDKSPVQIGEAIAALHDFALGTACLQCTGDVEKTSLVAVDSVGETALQRIASMIETLLRVASPVQ